MARSSHGGAVVRDFARQNQAVRTASGLGSGSVVAECEGGTWRLTLDRPRQRTDVAAEPLEDKAVLLDLVSGEYHILNRTGQLVWELCDGTRSIEELADALVAAYGVDRDQAMADVRYVVERLRRARLVDPA
jgi:hypothetical protein